MSAHHAFLDSPQKSEILLPQEDLLDFNWVMHMPLPSMESLPLDTHVMSIARFFFRGEENPAEYQKVMDKYRHRIIEATKSHKMVDGWRCDAEPGTREALVFTGWESKQAHDDYTTKTLDDSEYASVKNLCDGREVRHVRNMET